MFFLFRAVLNFDGDLFFTFFSKIQLDLRPVFRVLHENIVHYVQFLIESNQFLFNFSHIRLRTIYD